MWFLLAQNLSLCVGFSSYVVLNKFMLEAWPCTTVCKCVPLHEQVAQWCQMCYTNLGPLKLHWIFLLVGRWKINVGHANFPIKVELM